MTVKDFCDGISLAYWLDRFFGMDSEYDNIYSSVFSQVSVEATEKEGNEDWKEREDGTLMEMACDRIGHERVFEIWTATLDSLKM